MNTGIYVRVSTEEQAKEGFSIRAQDEKLRAYATIKDWTIYNVYIDEGISGKNIEDRPAVKQLIADIVSKKINNVLVYKIDRLTRSTKNLIELVELFNENRCAFNSLVESIDTTSATGRMFLKIVGIFAEFERENLIERVRFGLERKAREGYTLANFGTSYGYSREKGNKIQEVLEEESEVVKQIYDMYLYDDYSCNKIAITLNNENIPSKKGSKWSGATIKGILTNPNYIGKIRYSLENAERYFESEGKHEAILDDDTYYQVQDKIGKIGKISQTKRPKEEVYFCGVLYCPECGSKITTKWQTKKYKDGRTGTFRAYKCQKAMKGECKSGTFSHLKLEKAFEEYIGNIEELTETDTVEIPQENDSITNKETEKIEMEIGEIEKKTTEVMELFMSNKIDFPAYQTMIKMGTEKRNSLEIRLNVLLSKNQNKEVVISKTDIITNFKENWEYLNDKEKMQFIQKFIKKIVVNSESKKDVYKTITIKELQFNEY